MANVNWTEIVFGGMGGAVLSAVISWVIFRKMEPKPSGKAWQLLKGLNKVLGKQEGEIYFAKSATDQYQVASYLYRNADGPVIATAFHEDPSEYGDGDLARNFQFGGSLVRRLTSVEICPQPSLEKARAKLYSILPGATVIAIPAASKYVRLDGVFCRCSDGSHICLFAFRNPINPNKNTGVVFRDGMAASFFDYYSLLAEHFQAQSAGD